MWLSRSLDVECGGLVMHHHVAEKFVPLPICVEGVSILEVECPVETNGSKARGVSVRDVRAPLGADPIMINPKKGVKGL